MKHTKEWSEFNKPFMLPENIQAPHHLQAYLWRGVSAEQAVFLSDMKILNGE
jgi:hypothetical protein